MYNIEGKNEAEFLFKKKKRMNEMTFIIVILFKKLTQNKIFQIFNKRTCKTSL